MREVRMESSSLLLSLELLLIELKLSSFKDVAVAAAGLAWAGGNASKESTGVELVGNSWVDDPAGSVVLELGLEMLRPLGLSSGLVALFNLFLVKLNIVLSQVPLSEWVGINGDDAVLDDGLGSDKLVVGSVVDDIQNSGLSGEGLGTPGEVSSVDSQGTIFVVSTSTSDGSDSFLAQFGASWLSTHLELSLLLVDWHTTASRSSLVSRVSVNSHDPYESIATLYNNNEQHIEFC